MFDDYGRSPIGQWLREGAAEGKVCESTGNWLDRATFDGGGGEKRFDAFTRLEPRIHDFWLRADVSSCTDRYTRMPTFVRETPVLVLRRSLFAYGLFPRCCQSPVLMELQFLIRPFFP